MRAARGWLVPYLRSRLLAGDFHPITSYLFVEYKCNLDCWYCWSYNNKGMTEDVAKRLIDFLHDSGCRVVALMGGEPLLRDQFVHKVVYYAAKKGMWVYIATNGRLLRPELTDRLADAGWCSSISTSAETTPTMYGSSPSSRTKSASPPETPMLEQDDHFKHLHDNPTYIRPEDWGTTLRAMELPCRSQQRDYSYRWYYRPLLPYVFLNIRLGSIDKPKLEREQLMEMKKTCQRHCFSTLNHNLAYCYDAQRVMKWLWKQAKNGFGSGARSFED
jgi:hypothetical protein